MANYDDEGCDYQYQFSSSTTNIFFQNNDGLTYSLYWHPFDNPRFHPPPLYIMITVCSSSRGLIACRDPFSNYYIGNPLAEGEISYVSLPPPPRTHPSDATSVVLATDVFENGAPLAFHLICAVHVMANIYTFDTYSSLIENWLPSEQQVLRGEIRPVTGVSCGRMAYWLCEQTGVLGEVVEIDALTQLIRFLELPYPYQILAESNARVQLGRVGNRLGLVVVRERPHPRMELHVHDENGWRPCASLRFDLCADTGGLGWVGQNIAREFLQRTTVCGHRPPAPSRIVLGEMPQPLRFESFKMEVLLWVNGWLIVWENCSTNDSLRTGIWLCPVAGGTPAPFAHAIPHVCTAWLPGDFSLNH